MDQQDLSLTQSRSLKYSLRSLLGEAQEGQEVSVEEEEEERRMMIVSLKFQGNFWEIVMKIVLRFVVVVVLLEIAIDQKGRQVGNDRKVGFVD